MADDREAQPTGTDATSRGDETTEITEITEPAGSRLERSVTVDADVELAWELLTSPAELAGWLGDEVDLDPTPGSEGSVLDRDGTFRRLVVDEVRPGERITWRWWIDGDVERDASRVEITLTPAIGGTQVRVVEHRLPAATVQATACTTGATARRAWSWRLLHLELVSLVTVAVRA